MHAKAKQRISEATEQADARPELASKIPAGYNNFIAAISRLCDDIINQPKLTGEQKRKIAWLRSRIEIEM